MDAFDAFKKQIMREAAVASHLINGAYSTIPTGQTFSSDIDCRVRHYVALPPRAHVHRLSAPTDGSRAHHHAEIQQLSGLLTFTRNTHGVTMSSALRTNRCRSKASIDSRATLCGAFRGT